MFSVVNERTSGSAVGGILTVYLLHLALYESKLLALQTELG